MKAQHFLLYFTLSVFVSAAQNRTAASSEIAVFSNGVQVLNECDEIGHIRPINFGTINLGERGRKQFSIQNIGDKPLVVSKILTDGKKAAAFPLVFTTKKAIQPGEFSLFQVSFSPWTAGYTSVTLEIHLEGHAEQAFTFRLEGEGQIESKAKLSQVGFSNEKSKSVHSDP